MKITWLCAASALIVVAPRIAAAGRSDYGWLTGTEVLPERGAELQTWVDEENHEGPRHSSETNLWWGPAIGITDQLELLLPMVAGWERADGVPGAFKLRSYGAELRWRLVSSDPVDAPALVPLLRLVVARDISARDAVLAQAEVVTSYAVGPLRATASAAVYGAFTSADAYFDLHPGFGVSARITDELRLGAEVFGQLRLKDPELVNWVAAGPNLSWTHGRFWLSAAYGIGLSGLGTAPRVNWGVAF